MKNPLWGSRLLQGNRREWIGWLLLALALGFSLGVRARLLDMPLERDEGEFAYAGQLLLKGIPPYQMAYNMKLPGTYLVYAAWMALFGPNPAGIHEGLTAVNLATILVLFLMARDFGDPVGAGFAGLFYSILSVSPAVMGMAAHATHLTTLFGLGGAWLLWRERPTYRPSRLLGCGFLMGLAFLVKQQGVFFPLFGLAAILTGPKISQNSRERPVTASLAWYSAGAVLPYLGTCLWLWRAGVWERFWFWTVQYAWQYASQVPVCAAAGMLWRNGSNAVGPNWPIWLLATLGGWVLTFDPKAPRGFRPFFWGWTMFCFFCACPGFYFREHYFIPLLPPVALAAGWGAAWLGLLSEGRVSAKFWRTDPDLSPGPQGIQEAPPGEKPDPTLAGASRVKTIGMGVLLGLVVFIPLWEQKNLFFFQTPDAVCRAIYGYNPFLECPEIAQYIRLHSQPGQRVAVLGSEPEIYFYSDRPSATGYIYTYGLMEHQPFASPMQREMASEIERSQPSFILFVNVYTSWAPQSTADPFFMNWARAYLRAFYRPVGILDIQSPLKTECRWGGQVAGYQPRSPYYLVLFARK